MTRILVTLIFLVVLPIVASAASLNQAEILRFEQDQTGSARFIMRFTGNANEEIVDRPFPINGSTTKAQLENWIAAVVVELNKVRTAGKSPQVAPGTFIAGVPAAPKTPTAENIWEAKVNMYKTFCTADLAGDVATACTTLKSDIESTMPAGVLP